MRCAALTSGLMPTASSRIACCTIYQQLPPICNAGHSSSGVGGMRLNVLAASTATSSACSPWSEAAGGAGDGASVCDNIRAGRSFPAVWWLIEDATYGTLFALHFSGF